MHKMDDATNRKNYRSVSLLPVVSNIFEKLMQNQISGYVETYLHFCVATARVTVLSIHSNGEFH